MIDPNIPYNGSMLTRSNMESLLANRIIARHRSQIQLDLLKKIMGTSIAPFTKLCGSGALHGVYLHQRLPQDLDFEAPHVIVKIFQEQMKNAGIDLTAMEMSGNYCYADKHSAFPKLSTRLRVFPTNQDTLQHEKGEFEDVSGRTILVRCSPLHELLLLKLGGALNWSRPVDYVDLWLGLQEAPGIQDAMCSLLANRRWNGGWFTPPRRIFAGDIVNRINQISPDEWKQQLHGRFATIPSQVEVREQLVGYLSCFEKQHS